MSNPHSSTDIEAMDALYEQFVAPLEAEHRGQYIAVLPDGRFVLAASLAEAVHQGKDVLGPGNFVFKIGPRAVGYLR